MIPIPPPKKASCPPFKKKALKIPIQDSLFGSSLGAEDGKAKTDRSYTTKITAPIYKPSGVKPNIWMLIDKNKACELINKIAQAKSITEDEKLFLIEAARRHNGFHYNLIADYYANASSEMQRLMEDSALVIIDFDDALKNGYVRYTEEIAKIYEKEHAKP